jgi:major membrane immunogen (membrane-anchored lipoprotein)
MKEVRLFPLPGLVFCLLGVLFFPVSCGQEKPFLQDGYYTAEAEGFDEYGWKEFVSIVVNHGQITTVEYNAKNPSGFIKSWDMDYMRNMNAVDGTYPNEYTRYYADQFLVKGEAELVDALSGATHSYYFFKQLAGRVLENAHTGDTSVALVALEPPPKGR